MKLGTCDICEAERVRLCEGMCAPCCTRFGIKPDTMTTDRMLEVMAHHIGAANGVSIGELVTEMMHPQHVDPRERPSIERSVRELVVKLRLDGHHLCAHPSSGYFMAATPEELDAACSFLYDRAMTSLSQVAAMKRVSLPDLRGQLHLPT